MTVLSLFIILSAILLPVVMASDHHHFQVRADIQRRQVSVSDENTPTTTIGVVGTPLSLSQSPSPTVGKVGVPLHQQGQGQSGDNEDDGEVEVESTSTTQSPKVGVPTTRPGTLPIGFSTEIQTITPLVGTPKATSSPTPTESSSLSSSLSTGHSVSAPDYTVPIIAIGSVVIFLTLVGAIIWRLQKFRNFNRKHKDLEDEDAMEAYTKYWKGKRNSGGIAEKGNDTTSPVDEK